MEIIREDKNGTVVEYNGAEYVLTKIVPKPVQNKTTCGGLLISIINTIVIVILIAIFANALFFK